MAALIALTGKNAERVARTHTLSAIATAVYVLYVVMAMFAKAIADM